MSNLETNTSTRENIHATYKNYGEKGGKDRLRAGKTVREGEAMTVCSDKSQTRSPSSNRISFLASCILCIAKGGSTRIMVLQSSDCLTPLFILLVRVANALQ